MKSRSVLFLLVLFCLTAADAVAQKAIILVRHAERVDESRDSSLSAAGIERAQRLARMLRDAGITAIYTTEYQRTIKTAEPLGNLLKISPVVVSSNSGNELIAQVRRENAGGIVLVVGHSNSVPDLIRGFGAAEQITIATAEYDNLFVLTPQEGRPPVLVRLRF